MEEIMDRSSILSKPFIFAVLMIVLAGFLHLPAAGNDSAVQLTDPRELESFLDSFVTEKMKNDNIPGMVFVLVKDGEIFLSKGFGFSNLKSKAPMNPKETLVYLASATKPFTAAAVLQLAGKGKLDLHRDVNTYLEQFKVDNNFPQPVTLAHLLTHTAGFDDKNIGYIAHHQSGQQEMREYLAANLPPRVMPAGQFSSYSNHGFGLAGYLVERVSGLSYAQYVEENIFNPLAMIDSQVSLPLSPDKQKRLAVGYDYDYRVGGLVPCDLGYRNIPPAGSITTTAADMANFMTAILQKGRFNETVLLEEPEHAKMVSQQFTHHPELPGFTYGFYELKKKDLRLLTHAGGFIGYSSQIFLFPSRRMGIFVASNRARFNIYQVLLDKFVTRYLSGSQAAETQPPNKFELGKHELLRFNGMYQYTRYSRKSIEKIAIWDSQIRVEAGDGNFITIYPPRSRPIKYVPVKPLVFKHEKRDARIVFKEDEKGEITHIFSSLPGVGLPAAYEKLSWTDDVRIQRTILIILLLIYITALLGWPISGLIRRFFGRKRGPAVNSNKRATVAVWLNSFLAVVFLMGIDGLIGNGLYRQKLVWGMTMEMNVLLWVPFLIIALTAAAGWFTYKTWKERSRSLTGSILYTIVFAADVPLIAFLIHWNLLGFIY